METNLLFEENANKINIFDEVYPFRAAQEQAEKKKLSAFGMLAKFNPLNRPKEDTVSLSKQEVRYEPLWHLVARREVDFSCEQTYPVVIQNAYACSVQINGQTMEIERQGGKGQIVLKGLESCQRKIEFSHYTDGLKREIKPATLESYIRKYRYTEVESLDKPEAIVPLVSMTSLIQTAKIKLGSEAINAFEIFRDQIIFEKAHIYFRPVFAFEFVWNPSDKRGVIEIDGLTGEIIENGQWFKEKVKQVLTREVLFEISAEVAGSLVPGAGVAMKAVSKAVGSK